MAHIVDQDARRVVLDSVMDNAIEKGDNVMIRGIISEATKYTDYYTFRYELAAVLRLSHLPPPTYIINPSDPWETDINDILQEALANAPFESVFLNEQYEVTLPQDFVKSRMNGWTPISPEDEITEWTHPYLQLQEVELHFHLANVVASGKYFGTSSPDKLLEEAQRHFYYSRMDYTAASSSSSSSISQIPLVQRILTTYDSMEDAEGSKEDL